MNAIKNKNKSKKKENLDEIDKELISLEGLNISDKCIICEEVFNNINSNNNIGIIKNKKNEEINSLSESSDGMNIENNINEESKKENKNEYIVKCNNCKCPFHMICLANYEFEKNNDIFNLVPKKAECFVCGENYIWSEWVKDLTDQNKNK